MNKTQIVMVATMFLKSKGAYAKYMKNFKSRGLDFGEFANEQREGMLSGAFTWFESKEGHEYWEKLHREWLGVYSTMNA